jgi:histidinol-phosphate aminotransferase
MAIKIPHKRQHGRRDRRPRVPRRPAYLQSRVKAIVAERARLFDELQQFAWLKPYPSQANFILYRASSPRQRQRSLSEAQRKGILVRYFDRPLLKNSIRISVGKPEHTAALVKALRELAD